MSVPDYQSLMLSVLSVCPPNGEIQIGAVVERLAEQLCLTPEDRSELLPSGKQTLFSNRVHWAKTYLNKAGLVESTRRGHFKITARGQQVIDSHPQRIDNAFLNQFDEFRQFRERSSQGDSDDQHPSAPAFVTSTETPDEIIRVAHRQIEATLAQELLDRIRVAPARVF
jgi:restriction system protein